MVAKKKDGDERCLVGPLEILSLTLPQLFFRPEAGLDEQQDQQMKVCRQDCEANSGTLFHTCGEIKPSDL